MKVTVVGPNLRDQSRGDFHVHATGCGDLKRDRNLKNEDQSYVFDAASREKIAEEVYADIIGENEGSTGADYLDEFYFAPCVKELT